MVDAQNVSAIVAGLRFYADAEPNEWRGRVESNTPALAAIYEFLNPDEYLNCLMRDEQRWLMELVAAALESEYADGVPRNSEAAGGTRNNTEK